MTCLMHIFPRLAPGYMFSLPLVPVARFRVFCCCLLLAFLSMAARDDFGFSFT